MCSCRWRVHTAQCPCRVCAASSVGPREAANHPGQSQKLCPSCHRLNPPAIRRCKYCFCEFRKKDGTELHSSSALRFQTCHPPRALPRWERRRPLPERWDRKHLEATIRVIILRRGTRGRQTGTAAPCSSSQAYQGCHTTHRRDAPAPADLRAAARRYRVLTADRPLPRPACGVDFTPTSTQAVHRGGAGSCCGQIAAHGVPCAVRAALFRARRVAPARGHRSPGLAVAREAAAIHSRVSRAGSARWRTYSTSHKCSACARDGRQHAGIRSPETSKTTVGFVLDEIALPQSTLQELGG